ncbi:MAG: hypothetical protein AAF495_13350 [Pseudomonadota bacterium]
MYPVAKIVAYVAILLAANSATAFDKENFDLLKQLMIDGCSLGMEFEVEVEGDGNISMFLSRGAEGSVSFQKKELPAIVSEIEGDIAKQSLAADTRACMERFMNRLFDAVLNADTQSEHQPPSRSDPGSNFNIALAAARQLENTLQREFQFVDIAEAAMCQGKFETALEAIDELEPDLTREFLIRDLAYMSLCARDFEFSLGITSRMDEGVTRDHIVHRISELATSGENCYPHEATIHACD